jgi:glucosamine 6-phosphate synthetase-like amidotransferase/phosphosugar isomerase protein
LRSNHQWVNESNGSALGHQRPRRYLEEGDWAVVTSKKVVIFDRANQPIERQVRETALSGALIGKGNYRHFMQKEIFEEPAVIGKRQLITAAYCWLVLTGVGWRYGRAGL